MGTKVEFFVCQKIYNSFLPIYVMIQNNKSKLNELERKVQEICETSLGYFVEKLPLARSNFPVMEVTFTLWRKYAYGQAQKYFGGDQKLRRHGIRVFHSFSEKKYLPFFVKRLQTEMNVYCRGLQNVEENLKQLEQLPKKEEEIYELIIELGNSVWLQQLYLELLEDLIYLPYLELVSPKSVFNPKPQFMTDYVFRRERESKIKKMANRAGKNIFNKILTVITQTVFSKAFMIKVNTLFGTFNPVLIGASFGLTRYLDHLDQKKKDQHLEVQLKMALDFGRDKVDRIKSIYEKCLQQIEKIATTASEEQEKERKKGLKELFLSIFEEEWLRIEVKMQEDGWQAVTFQQKQSFQQLTE